TRTRPVQTPYGQATGRAPCHEAPWRPGREPSRSAHELLELVRQFEVLPALLRQAEGVAALRRGAPGGGLLLLLLALHRVTGALLALGLLLLLLLTAGAAPHAGDAGHPGDAAALGHAGHHLAGLEE